MCQNLKKEHQKASLDLVLIIDNSGSMGGSKIKLVKETIAYLLKELNEDDRFALIVFSSESEISIPLTKMNEEGKEKARKIVKRIRTGGGTNLKTPVVQALEILS